jgi:subtilisin family serine protease
MTRYLLRKLNEPEAFGDAYVASLETLSGEEHLLMSTDKTLIKVREIPDEDEQAQLSRLRAREHILSVEPDYTARAPEPVEVEAAQRLSARQARAFHGIDELHRAGYTGKGQRIAVIDTGISEALADSLGSRLVVRESFVSGEDWRDTDSLHGTWCISAIARACPGAEIVSLKGLSTKTGSGSYSGIIAAVERARALGCTGISLSLGGPASDILDSAVNAADGAGVIVAAAAGNEQRGKVTYEADNKSPARAVGALCTAVVDSDSRVASFSNHGTAVDIAAIGVYVEAEDLPGKWWSGTSMAAPYAMATAALVRSAGHGKSATKQALLSGCRDTPAPSYQEGYGIADALRSYRRVEPEPGEYHPGVPRCTKTQWERGAYKQEHVVTFGRKYIEVGHWLPKESVFE